jgi:GAF domain-containing protein
MSEMDPGARSDDSPASQRLASWRGLFELSTVLTTASDETEVVRRIVAAVPSSYSSTFIRLDRAWRPEAPDVPDLPRLEAQLAALGPAGGRLRLPVVSWAWAYPLAGHGDGAGLLLVTAGTEPSKSEQMLLGLLARQAANALANARLHRQEQDATTRERAAAEDLRSTNLALERSAAAADHARDALQHRMDNQARLAQVAVAGEGPDGIARTLHELTGHPVAIEDRFGTLIAWAGPGRPDPYPKATPAEREELIRTVVTHGTPLHSRDRVVAVARLRDEVLGVISVIDRRGTWAEEDWATLDHGAMVLALELAHRRSVAEVELRLGRDLVEELLAGGRLDGIPERFRAIGYDLDRPHRVVELIVTSRHAGVDASFQAVRRAARDSGVGSLLLAHDGGIAILSAAAADWEAFRLAVVAELGPGARCRVGVGGPCSVPADFARSDREALLALRVQAGLAGADQVSVFDDLGVYSLLSESADIGSVERFVQRWLGALREYDATKGGELVRTLTEYLECGGSYDRTATRLSIHRSSVRYRLGRIRLISGHDLADADTRFNLHLATRAWSTVLALRHA